MITRLVYTAWIPMSAVPKKAVKLNHSLTCMIYNGVNGINSLRPSDAYICVSELTIIGSDNGLSPGRRQAIIWNNAGLLLIEPLGTNFSEISIGIQTFSFKKMHLNMSSAKWRPFCLGLNVIIPYTHDTCKKFFSAMSTEVLVMLRSI